MFITIWLYPACQLYLFYLNLTDFLCRWCRGSKSCKSYCCNGIERNISII
jgi:hypothetical protein